MKTLSFLLCLSVASVALAGNAGAQNQTACRSKCGYVETFGPDSGKRSQTPAVNACYRKCMKRAPSRAAR